MIHFAIPRAFGRLFFFSLSIVSGFYSRVDSFTLRRYRDTFNLILVIILSRFPSRLVQMCTVGMNGNSLKSIRAWKGQSRSPARLEPLGTGSTRFVLFESTSIPLSKLPLLSFPIASLNPNRTYALPNRTFQPTAITGTPADKERLGPESLAVSPRRQGTATNQNQEGGRGKRRWCGTTLVYMSPSGGSTRGLKWV